MPFMGKDWRSPGEAWVKTETLGWQRMKIIESQLHPGHCHQSPACSWPPKSEFGSHMANYCGTRVQEFRDRLSSGSSGSEDSNSSTDSSRAGSQSPSPVNSPEKNQQLLHHNHYHHHHLHPITISSPYGKYSCCAYNIELAGSSPNYYPLNDKKINQKNAQLISKSLSKESITINNTNDDSQPKMRYNNSVSDFRSTSSLENNNESQFNNKSETLTSHNMDKMIRAKSNNLSCYSNTKPILMKNGFRINDTELPSSFSKIKSMDSITNDNTTTTTVDNNNFSQTPTGKNNCCCFINNNFNGCCNYKEPYVKTAPHCRISVRTREVAMYNTISEAFYRLDFCNAIHDIRRFNYICKLLHLLITQNLTSLSGCATKVLFTMLEQVAWEVSNNKRNIHVLKNLLDDLKKMIKNYYCWGRPIGSSLLWQQHFHTIERISQIVDGIELSPPKSDNTQITFNDLPVEMIREILLRLNDYRDLVNSAQASPVMRTMIDGQYIWRKLCKYHFTEQQLKLAIEHNNLFTKRGNVRGLKYARTASADGKTSFRNPVMHKTTTKELLELTKGRRCSRQSTSKDSKNIDESSNASSYVTRAIKIFDKQGGSTTLAPSKIKKTTPEHISALQKQNSKNNNNNHLQLHNNKNQQEVNEGKDNSSANHTSNEIDWERIFHQLRKKFDLKEEYADCLLLCRHCRCLFWKSFGHPCIKGDNSSMIPDPAQLYSCDNHQHHHWHCNQSALSRNNGDSRLMSSNQINNLPSDIIGSSSLVDSVQINRNSHSVQQQNRPSVAVLSRNFSNRTQGNENLPPHPRLHHNQIAQSNNDSHHNQPSSSVANPLNGPLMGRNAVNRRLIERNQRDHNNVGNNLGQSNELVPKHVAISPQAFLKFFSL